MISSILNDIVTIKNIKFNNFLIQNIYGCNNSKCE